MNLKTILLMSVVAVFASCKPEIKNCTQLVEVPFESVSIPDSVPTGGIYVIDARLHDMGCYQATDLRARIHCDTVFLMALAEYDECGCPQKSNGLDIKIRTSIDTATRYTTKYYVYWQINSTKDSISYRWDSVYFY